MAINFKFKKRPSTKEPPHEPMIREYWPRYRGTAMRVTIIMELALTLIVGLSLIVGEVDPTSRAFWVTILATGFASVMINIVLVTVLIIPHHDLVTALAHSAGEKLEDPMPSPNARHYTKNGFKPVLQFVYDKAVEDARPASAPEGDSQVAAMLETALNQTKAGIVVLNGNGKVLYHNKNAPVTTGTNEKPMLELVFEKEGEFEQWLAECRESQVRSERMWRRVPNKVVGEEDRRIFDVTANYEKGSAAEIVLVSYDYSSDYQPEDDDLDFIAFAAHELRGPITVIRGYLDVLDIEVSDKLEPDQRLLMSRLIVSANRLSGYINNILNTSKYDRRHLNMHLVEDTVANVYDTISDDMNLRASSQNRLLRIEIPTNLPTIAADRSSLSEVIGNLIDNALKYSNEGSAVFVQAKQKDDNYVEVSVQDNGIGMPANVVGNLFHKFYRSHRSRETVAGTGIGLYICKAIVESHGGTISVSSVEGQGSTFTFTVPTYAYVKDRLLANDNTNQGIISSSEGWIKNHSKFMG